MSRPDGGIFPGRRQREMCNHPSQVFVWTRRRISPQGARLVSINPLTVHPQERSDRHIRCCRPDSQWQLDGQSRRPVGHRATVVSGERMRPNGRDARSVAQPVADVQYLLGAEHHIDSEHDIVVRPGDHPRAPPDRRSFRSGDRVRSLRSGTALIRGSRSRRWTGPTGPRPTIPRRVWQSSRPRRQVRRLMCRPS